MVGPKNHPQLWKNEFLVEDFHWIEPFDERTSYSVSIRHRDKPVNCFIEGNERIKTKDVLYAPCAGQFADFYNGDYCVGSAKIK